MNLNKIILSITLCIMSGICSTNAHQTVVHVFIHGTRFSWLAALSLVATYRQRLNDNSWYTRIMNYSRTNPIQFDAEIMQEPGLHEITQEIMGQVRWGILAPEYGRRAAIQAITAYDSLIDDRDGVSNRYYTFGWNGMLSIQERQKAAEKLYDELLALRINIREQHTDEHITFVLHGHSHGGNVVLNLAYWEEQKHEGLSVAYTLLYGTPMQIETVNYAQSAIFEKIISFYSTGDSRQVADWVSTRHPALRGNRRLSDFFTWTNEATHYRIDVNISLNGDPSAFSHTSYFWLDDIYYRNNPQFTALRPLPVVCFAPQIIPLIDRIAEHSTNINLDAQTRTGINWQATTVDESHTQTSPDLRVRVEPIKALIKSTWNPICSTQVSLTCHMIKDLALAALSQIISLFWH